MAMSYMGNFVNEHLMSPPTIIVHTSVVELLTEPIPKNMDYNRQLPNEFAIYKYENINLLNIKKLKTMHKTFQQFLLVLK